MFFIGAEAGVGSVSEGRSRHCLLCSGVSESRG